GKIGDNFFVIRHDEPKMMESFTARIEKFLVDAATRKVLDQLNLRVARIPERKVHMKIAGSAAIHRLIDLHIIEAEKPRHPHFFGKEPFGSIQAFDHKGDLVMSGGDVSVQ